MGMLGRWFGKLCKVVGFLTILLFMLTAPLLYFAGQWMQVHDQPRKADFILPLAGDAHRMIHAADLYKQGYAPNILVSVPASKPPTILAEIKRKLGYPQYDSVTAYAKAFYGILDIPAIALVPFGFGHLSTVEEGENLAVFLGPGKHTILVVTSPYHARRGKMVLEAALPESEIIMTTTPYEHFEERWWADYHTAPKVVLEAVKCLHYLFGGVFRSTD